MVVAILACQVALSIETSSDTHTLNTSRRSCRARIRRRHVPRSSWFLDNIPWYCRVLMDAWGKFHPTEYSSPCTTQHVEWPAYRDDLPYQWPAAPLWDRVQRLAPCPMTCPQTLIERNRFAAGTQSYCLMPDGNLKP